MARLYAILALAAAAAAESKHGGQFDAALQSAVAKGDVKVGDGFAFGQSAGSDRAHVGVVRCIQRFQSVAAGSAQRMGVCCAQGRLFHVQLLMQ